MLKPLYCGIFLAMALLLGCSSPTATPAPTEEAPQSASVSAAPAPTEEAPQSASVSATPAPTEEAPKSASVSGTLAPLDIKDPDAFMSELPGAEQACVSENSDLRQFMALMSAEGLASSEETAKLIQCLGDETLLRLFLTGLIGQTEPLTEETSTCVRSGFADFDIRAVMIAGVVESDAGAAMRGSMAAFLVTLACLNEEEWQAVGSSVGMGPDDRESLQCLMNELGGSKGIAAALQPDDGGPPTDYIGATIACGLQSPGGDSSAGGVGDDLDLVRVGSVNDVEFSAGDLVQRILVFQGVNRYHGRRTDRSAVPFESLQNMITAEILRQAAPELDIQPT